MERRLWGGGLRLWSELGPAFPPNDVCRRVGVTEKKRTPGPRLSRRPIPRVSPGLRSAGGCRVRLAEALRVGDFIAMGR